MLSSSPIDGKENQIEPVEDDVEIYDSEWIIDKALINLNIRALARWLQKGDSDYNKKRKQSDDDNKRKVERERFSVRVAGDEIPMTLKLIKGGLGGIGLEWLFTAGVLKGLWIVEDKIKNMKELFKKYKEVLQSGDYAAQEMVLSTSKSGGNFVINVRLAPDEFERLNNVAELYGYERPLIIGRLFSLGLMTEDNLPFLSEETKMMLKSEAGKMLKRLWVRMSVIEALHKDLIDNKKDKAGV